MFYLISTRSYFLLLVLLVFYFAPKFYLKRKLLLLLKKLSFGLMSNIISTENVVLFAIINTNQSSLKFQLNKINLFYSCGGRGQVVIAFEYLVALKRAVCLRDLCGLFTSWQSSSLLSF